MKIDCAPFSVTRLTSVRYENLLFFRDMATITRCPGAVKHWLPWAISASSHSTFLWITFCRIHCVTETRDWEEFTDFVYSCCQVNVNVRVSVSAAMGGVVTLRSVTCSLDCEVLKVSSSLGCTHLGWLANVLVKRPFLVNWRARWFAHSWKAFSAAHCSSFNEIGSPVLI